MKHLIFRRLCVFLLFLMGSSPLILADSTLTITNGAISNDKLPLVPNRTIEYISNGVIVSYSFKEAFSFAEEDAFEAYHWRIPGFNNISEEGLPALPFRVDIFNAPVGYEVSYTVIEEEYMDYEVATAISPKIGFGPSASLNEAIEAPYDGFYPLNTVYTSNEKYRGRPLYKFFVIPIQYNKKNNITRFYTNLSYKVEYVKKGQAKEAALSSLPKMPANNIIERISIPLVESSNEDDGVINPAEWTEECPTGLLITHNGLANEALRYIKWKKAMGYKFYGRVSKSWTYETVKQAVKDAYDNYEIEYLVILGDNQLVPGFDTTKYHDGTVYNYVTDHKYVCMDGEGDSFADIHKGRIPVSSKSEAEKYISKLINYEKNPPTEEAYYKRGLFIGRFQDGEQGYALDNYEDTRFIFTCENIRNYLNDWYLTDIARVYQADEGVTPIGYSKYWTYNFQSGYTTQQELDSLCILPAELRSESFNWHNKEGQNAYRDLIAEWEKQPAFVYYSGHGDVNRWGRPWFQSGDFLNNPNLVNAEKPSLVFSITCRTGEFDKPGCLASALVLQQGGPIGVFACTCFSWQSAQFPQIETLFNTIWNADFINPLFGWFQPNNIRARSRVVNYNKYPYTHPFPESSTMGEALDESTYRLEFFNLGNDTRYYHRYITHYFGDPTMRFFTSKPGTSQLPIITNRNGVYVTSFSYPKPDCVTVWDTKTDQMINYRCPSKIEITTDHIDDYVISVKTPGKIPAIWKGSNVSNQDF